MNQLPKKITPDSLLDTFVEVHFSLAISVEVMLAEAQSLFAPVFAFVQPTQDTKHKEQKSSESLFFGQGVLFRLRGDLISFTCSEGYLGWTKYREVIQKVVHRMYDAKWLSGFPRVGVRYINALPWAPMNQQLQVQLPSLPSLPAPERTYYQSVVKSPDGFFIMLALTNNKESSEEQSGPLSLFDVGVLWRPTTHMRSLAEVFDKLDQAHSLEKQVFFGLISPQFLEHLNPEY